MQRPIYALPGLGVTRDGPCQVVAFATESAFAARLRDHPYRPGPTGNRRVSRSVSTTGRVAGPGQLEGRCRNQKPAQPPRCASQPARWMAAPPEPDTAWSAGVSIASSGEFARFYQGAVRPVTRYFVARVRCHQQADDLSSSTFLAAYTSRADYDNCRGTPHAWVFGIARHQLAQWQRRQNAYMRAVGRVATRERLDSGADHTSSEPFERVDEAVSNRQATLHAVAALGHLSGRQATALRLRVLGQLPYADLAASLGCSDGAARVRVSRGLRVMATALETRAAGSREKRSTGAGASAASSRAGSGCTAEDAASARGDLRRASG